MILGHKKKQPREVRRFKISYERWLSEGEIITDVTSEVDVTTGTSPLVVDTLIIDPVTEDSITFYVKDGDDGETYKVTFITTTNDDRIVEDEVEIRVEEV